MISVKANSCQSRYEIEYIYVYSVGMPLFEHFDFSISTDECGAEEGGQKGSERAEK